MKALEVRDLVKTFGTGEAATPVLRGISATIERGEFVALVGASGSGKSTFLAIAGTLLAPTSGSLRVVGVDPSGMHEHELARVRNQHLGFAFQFHHLLEDFTALENVLMPVYGAHARISSTWHKRALELLARVGLADRIAFRTSKLSGGQKQRVAVARAVVMRPELVLADEPTGNLDSTTAREVMALILDHVQRHGATLVLVTHDEELAATCTDRVIRLKDGRLLP